MTWGVPPRKIALLHHSVGIIFNTREVWECPTRKIALPRHSAGIIFNTRVTWETLLGKLSWGREYSPAIARVLFLIPVRFGDSLWGREYPLCYSAGIIFNTRVTWGVTLEEENIHSGMVSIGRGVFVFSIFKFSKTLSF